jgi:hypothetical protein
MNKEDILNKWWNSIKGKVVYNGDTGELKRLVDLSFLAGEQKAREEDIGKIREYIDNLKRINENAPYDKDMHYNLTKCFGRYYF